MSDIVKDIFSTTDKLNFLSNKDNITKLVSNFENFASNDDESEEDRRKRLCKMVITIIVLYKLTIFVALFFANSTGVISNTLFMGLSLLTLAMPDVVLVILILLSIVGSGRNSVPKIQAPPEYSATSSEGPGNLKYVLTQTPDVFN